MDIREKIIHHDPETGTTRVVKRHETTVTGGERAAFRLIQFVWFLAGVIETLLILRFVFEFLGANLGPFTLFLYGLTSPLVVPFRGIFAAREINGFFIDTAALLAMVITVLAGWLIAAFVDILNP